MSVLHLESGEYSAAPSCLSHFQRGVWFFPLSDAGLFSLSPVLPDSQIPCVLKFVICFTKIGHAVFVASLCLRAN